MVPVLGVASAAVLVTGAWSATAVAAGATVGVDSTPSFGTVLTDAQGFALYTFGSDHNGMSSCTGTCAQVWPALTVPAGTTPSAGPGVTGTVASVLESNGTYQVTYDGSPLYTFASDSSPGQVSGNGVGGFSVVKVAAAPAPSAPTTAVPAPTVTGTAPTTAAPGPVAAASGSTTSPASSPGAPATSPGTASAPSPVQPRAAAATGSLAFTGPGDGLRWTAVAGAGLVVVAIPLVILAGGRRAGRRSPVVG
jgi:predicted lipoprotein with Yx(FWY)xxD motif